MPIIVKILFIYILGEDKHVCIEGDIQSTPLSQSLYKRRYTINPLELMFVLEKMCNSVSNCIRDVIELTPWSQSLY